MRDPAGRTGAVALIAAVGMLAACGQAAAPGAPDLATQAPLVEPSAAPTLTVTTDADSPTVGVPTAGVPSPEPVAASANPTATAGVRATAKPTPRPTRTPSPTCVTACFATANPNPTPGGNWTISVTTPTTVVSGTPGMDYHVHISGTVVCGGCQPYDVGCFVELAWPSLGGTNKYSLNETAGEFTANQTWREPTGSYSEVGVWHWYFHCRTASGSNYVQRDDEGTFEVVPAPTPSP